jgi:DNA polymerase III delta subunit
MTRTPDTRTTAEKLDSVRDELKQWRQLAFDASQARNGASYGRCTRRIEQLERIETALQRRLAR